MARKGHKVEDVTGMQNIMFDLKPNRCEAEVFMSADIDVTEFVKFMKKEKEKHPDLTFFHGFVYIMGRVIHQYSKMNRFVQNRTLYEHDTVEIAFVGKAEFNDSSEEFMKCLPVGNDDTLYDVSDSIKKCVEQIRSKNTDIATAGANNVVDKLGHIWRPLRSFLVGILKWWDCKFGLPGAIADDNIYYSSAIVSNLGTSSSLIAFGEIREENGKKVMNLGATLDERIADGFYFCRALKAIEYLFAHPELMLEPASKPFEIPDNVQKKHESKK